MKKSFVLSAAFAVLFSLAGGAHAGTVTLVNVFHADYCWVQVTLGTTNPRPQDIVWQGPVKATQEKVVTVNNRMCYRRAADPHHCVPNQWSGWNCSGGSQDDPFDFDLR